MRASLEIREHVPSALGLDAGVLGSFAARSGPLAVVDLETTGLASEPESELLEFGALLIDPGSERLVTVRALVRPERPLPRWVTRLTGICDSDVAAAPALGEVRADLASALEKRLIVAHNADFERHFLASAVAPELAEARYLDTLDLVALTHPDAPDLRLESLTRIMLHSEEHHRALEDALDTARVLSVAGLGSLRGEARFATARRALETFAPDSPWLALLGPENLVRSDAERSPFVAIGASAEAPVPFSEDAIAAALADEDRGRRHFPGYRVRAEQIQLARRFARNFAQREILLLEGGTGVGKSLAYLAAAIPFAIERERVGARDPLLISTRTKLLQDQLLHEDIGAAARMLGYPELRALSIKGRANYACARRLEATLAEGREPRLLAEDRLAYAVLASCVRTRPQGEIGSLPGALARRFPPLRDLRRRAVAARADQCSREQCATERDCPLGRQRAALGSAHLVVANHDLLLRWPADYPTFTHAIVDEVHELSDVADEVYVHEVRAEELIDRFDELFGSPRAQGRWARRPAIPAASRAEVRGDIRFHRDGLRRELAALGRSLADEVGDFGEIQLPDCPGPRFEAARKCADAAAGRLDGVADTAAGLAREAMSPRLERGIHELRQTAEVLALAFSESRPEAVTAFEGVAPPFDRWRLVMRPVSPAGEFHARFLDRLSSFAGVSASIFAGGDAFAALGDLDLEARAGERLQRDSVTSPFPYARQMRVVALQHAGDLHAETTAVLEELALRLGGRTLGLFTSLQRMRAVAEELAYRLRPRGIDVLLPRRATDDPRALVTRFVRGGAVLLGARKFWQGLDIPGPSLQAVVIEKLPFEVPTELRRRRERRLLEDGIDAFGRYTLGKMLLNLKQMVGRLIRTEEDRGIVVIVDARTERRYFRRLEEALPPGIRVAVAPRRELGALLAEVGIGAD